MSTIFAAPQSKAFDAPRVTRALGSRRSRLLLIALVLAAGAAAFVLTGSDAAAVRDLDLTRLLRFMTALKGAMASLVVGAVLWRLGDPIGIGRFTAYAISCATMVAGPGLIWGMSHVGLGALFLHGGLLASVVLLWRDPAVTARLAMMVVARGRRHRAGD